MSERWAMGGGRMGRWAGVWAHVHRQQPHAAANETKQQTKIISLLNHKT